GADGVVLARELDALVERARGVPGFETGVPERAMQVLGDEVRARTLRLPVAGQEGEEIDVRARRQLAPAVPAGRYQRERNALGTGKLREDRYEQPGDDLIGERGDGAYDLLPARPAAVPRQDLVAAFRQPRLCPRHRRVVHHVPQHNKTALRASFRARRATFLERASGAEDLPVVTALAGAPPAAVRGTVGPCVLVPVVSGPSRVSVLDRFPAFWWLPLQPKISVRPAVDLKTQGARARRRRDSTKSFTPRAMASAVPSWKR